MALRGDPREVLEADALADYERHYGKVLFVREVYGFKGDDSVDLVLDPPVRMLVASTYTGDITRWCDDWIDPHWDVVPLEHHPDLDGVTSLHVYGISYNLNGEVDRGNGWILKEA